MAALMPKPQVSFIKHVKEVDYKKLVTHQGNHRPGHMHILYTTHN